MDRIDTLQLHNFKFFDKQEPIKLGGKHLLLYGENGSGKSSIYWGLYTLFKASQKGEVDEITKYFKHIDNHEESLVNIYAPKVSVNGSLSEHYDSFIETTTTNTPPNTFKISLFDTDIISNEKAMEVEMASDFISYKVLYTFQHFWADEKMDLANIFIGQVLPYIDFPSKELIRNGQEISIKNAFQMYWEITKGPGMTKNYKGQDIQVYKNSPENRKFNAFAQHFSHQMKDLIDFINISAPKILKDFGYDIDFQLSYKDIKYKKRDSQFTFSNLIIDFAITNYMGKEVILKRPHTFLNEAKLTALALAIRLSILKRRVNSEVGDILKFIVFDDLMISLDMSNRDKLLDYLLNPQNKYTKDYQLLFLTHDNSFYNFVINKIKQWDNTVNWVFKEMYIGNDPTSNKEFPVIIDSEFEFIDKAKKYYVAKDYTACSIYIRKELEKIVNIRLPEELKYKSDGAYLSLQTLWGNMVSRYECLGSPISDEMKKMFEETKLMVLNPQAHFQKLSLPVYKVELEKAFELIEKLNNSYPIPEQTILLTKGMKLQFKHPSTNYTFNFELLSDCYIDVLNGVKEVKLPKCIVQKWQYQGVDYLCPHNGVTLNQTEISEIQSRKEDKLDKILANLKKDNILQITSQIFIDNTKILNSVWSLKDVLDKVGITL